MRNERNALLDEAQQQDYRSYRSYLAGLDDDGYLRETFNQIDRANGHPTYSVYDQRANLCWEEGERSGRGGIYQRAFTVAYRMAKGDQQHHRAWEALVDPGRAVG